MSVDLAKPFLFPLNDISDARLNAKTIMVDTAVNCFNFSKTPGQVFITTTNGNGYVKDQPYFISTDGTQTIAIGVRKHKHSADTDPEGGFLSDIEIYNIGNAYFANLMQYTKGSFFLDTSGTGAAVTDVIGSTSGGVEADSGTSTNGYANIRRMGVALWFARENATMMRFELDGTLTNYVMRAGVCAEKISDSNDATQESYGIEACSGQSNWIAWSCNGTTRSTTATPYAVDTDAHAWYIHHYPDDTIIQYTQDVDFDNTTDKITDIPTSGSTLSKCLFGMGVTTTNTTSKQLTFRGAAIAGTNGQTSWRWFA